MKKCRMSKVKQQKEKEMFNCKRCGRRHPPEQCPTYGKICAKCKGQNHFAKQCFSKGRQSQKGHVDAVEETDLSDTFFAGMVEQAYSSQKRTEQTEVNSVAQDKWMTALEINGIIVSLKLYTGAKVDMILFWETRHPVVHAPRRVPAPLREKLRQELEEPTEWVNSMTREEIISKMASAEFFTKLDASQGFWQLKLHKDSTKYCTFNTPFGRYSFLRMPFRISSAPEVFHRAMEHLTEGIDGVHVYVDDIVLWGSTIEQHNKRLMEVLQRVQNYGLKLNKDECQFGAKEITFLGDKLTEGSVEPDE
ncbi:hypothetical protein H4Q32_029921 [Labeo rohita]|uniref:ribonuclease H n=1 Tax=Labeo rohita TaxID=84645 RepID=A0ABQ8L803_LABRO|nr:hypothetical protein H4Q32_029921 [Labeo rohita]